MSASIRTDIRCIRTLFRMYSDQELKFSYTPLGLVDDPQQQLQVWVVIPTDTPPNPEKRTVGDVVEGELVIDRPVTELIRELLDDTGDYRQFQNLMGWKFNVWLAWPRFPEPIVAEVTFFDDRYKCTALGQHISTYRLETLLMQRTTNGLSLRADEIVWQIDQETMDEVYEWLEGRVAICKGDYVI